jgi:hypothetical protein
MTRQDILNAIAAYNRQFPNNDYDSWRSKGTYHWAVSHGGRLYPPKWLVAQVSHEATPNFHTNSALRRLRQCGFACVVKP